MAAIDKEMVDDLKSMLGEDFGMFLDTFRTDLLARCDAIQAAVSAGDAYAVRQAAHSLKGSSSNLGAVGLSSACANLEETALKGELVQAQGLTDTIFAQKLEVLTALQDFG